MSLCGLMSLLNCGLMWLSFGCHFFIYLMVSLYVCEVSSFIFYV
jgi:hypothetical protein